MVSRERAANRPQNAATDPGEKQALNSSMPNAVIGNCSRPEVMMVRPPAREAFYVDLEADQEQQRINPSWAIVPMLARSSISSLTGPEDHLARGTPRSWES
jgi:hypothetical protein